MAVIVNDPQRDSENAPAPMPGNKRARPLFDPPIVRISTFDEMLTTLVSAALAEVANRQNQDMRKISAWAAIALVPTAIAGIYGMNFKHIPELDWTFGYPMAILGIILVCSVLYFFLRRKRWL